MDEHIEHMRALLIKAKEFAANKNLTPVHRKQCKDEARIYSEIIVRLETNPKNA